MTADDTDRDWPLRSLLLSSDSSFDREKEEGPRVRDVVHIFLLQCLTLASDSSVLSCVAGVSYSTSGCVYRNIAGEWAREKC